MILSTDLHFVKGPFHDPQPHHPLIFVQKKLMFLHQQNNVCVQNISCKFICWRNNQSDCLFIKSI